VLPRGLLERAQAGLESARRTIAGVLEEGAAPASYLALAPLLERHEAPAVAAALYDLWSAARSGQPEPAPAARPVASAARLWVGIGRRDAVTPHDLVGTLVKECAVPKEQLGRIEIRETFTIVEIAPEAGPEAVAERMTGKMIRKRRLVARVDRGRPAGRDRARPA
jgi:ATP-dependent RNA helicase DeaD